MAVNELKKRMGWVSCPKDKVVHLIDLHCAPPLEKCPYFVVEAKDKLYCTYGTSTGEEKAQ